VIRRIEDIEAEGGIRARVVATLKQLCGSSAEAQREWNFISRQIAEALPLRERTSAGVEAGVVTYLAWVFEVKGLWSA
jgi:hypothetical protein